MPEAGMKEAVRFYAKQLKLPTFANLEEAAGKFRTGDSLESFVLTLMKREYDARQEKTRQRRLKRAHFPLHKTLEEFDLARLQHIQPEFVKQLASCTNDLLLIDELSYARFNQEESELLFKVIAERSEGASTIITMNLVFSKRKEIFASDTLVAALFDRLTYHAHVLNMNGESYRLSSQQQRLNMS